MWRAVGLGLVLLLVSAADPCFALLSIAQVSKEQAKEWGMEVRWKAAGPGRVWVEVEFKKEGRLQGFDGGAGQPRAVADFGG